MFLVYIELNTVAFGWGLAGYFILMILLGIQVLD